MFRAKLLFKGYTAMMFHCTSHSSNWLFALPGTIEFVWITVEWRLLVKGQNLLPNQHLLWILKVVWKLSPVSQNQSKFYTELYTNVNMKHYNYIPKMWSSTMKDWPYAELLSSSQSPSVGISSTFAVVPCLTLATKDAILHSPFWHL